MAAPALPLTISQPPTALGADEDRLFIDRELSLLEFNRRVLAEAADSRHPLLERVKFLSIFGSNLDEFFMIRVSGLKQQLAHPVDPSTVSGLRPSEKLQAIRQIVLPLQAEAHRIWRKDLLPQLTEHGIYVLDYAELTPSQQSALKAYFEREIFPVLTPLAVDPGHPFPHISNLSLNLAVTIQDPDAGELFARVKVPGTLPRLIPVPTAPTSVRQTGLASRGEYVFTWLEQVIAANLGALFPGLDILQCYPFRVTRNADLEIQEDEAADLLRSVERSLRTREFGIVVRLEVSPTTPEEVADLLIDNLEITADDIYSVDSPLGLVDVRLLSNLDRPDLKDSPFVPHIPSILSTRRDDLFAALQRHDILLHHPFDSFVPVVDFIRTAAHDPQVLAIKQTLYRVGSNSPIVQALLEARENDKQVAVLVELKARFDEENNIEWARELEDSGVHVVYGLLGLKTHCKVALVVRKERDSIRRYVHLGTGNYNATTARLYTDLGFMTSDPAFGADISELFNFLTGYSRQKEYRKLLVAPTNLRQQLTARIEREMEHQLAAGDGHLIFKLNALIDPEMIRTLYRASQAGVRIDLLVRGMCCLRPGVPGLSEHIRVASLVGRFLEHTRIYYFHNGGAEEIYLGSADLMQRNLDRRVETLFPIEDPALKSYVLREILEIYLRDNSKTWLLQPDGTYVRVRPGPGEASINAQEALIPGRGQDDSAGVGRLELTP